MNAQLPRNLCRFALTTLRLQPRPPGYLREMAGCRERITPDGLWEFDEDAPCFKTLRAKYKDYRPTKDDLYRVQLFNAELRAQRDELTRGLWGGLHHFCLSPEARDPAKLAGFLKLFARRVPCGDCRTHWAQVLAEFPPNAADPFAWSVWAHNAVNRLLKKRGLTVAEARARWATAPPAP